MNDQSDAKIIYHITTSDLWDEARRSGSYTVPSLPDEGFIHCSERAQVERSLNKYYADQPSVPLLHIDAALLRSELKYEPAAGMMFPHVYGPVNLDAVTLVEPARR